MIGPVGCLEPTVTMHHPVLRNVPEERRLQPDVAPRVRSGCYVTYGENFDSGVLRPLLGVRACVRVCVFGLILRACRNATISLDVIIALDMRAERDAPLLPARCPRANRRHPTSVVSFRHSRYGAKVMYIEEVVEIWSVPC